MIFVLGLIYDLTEEKLRVSTTYPTPEWTHSVRGMVTAQIPLHNDSWTPLGADNEVLAVEENNMDILDRFLLVTMQMKPPKLQTLDQAAWVKFTMQAFAQTAEDDSGWHLLQTAEVQVEV